MTDTISRPLAIAVPVRDTGRYHQVREIEALRAPSYPCSDRLRDAIERRPATSREHDLIVDLITGQTFVDTRGMRGNRFLRQTDPVLGPIHGLGLLLPHRSLRVQFHEPTPALAARIARHAAPVEPWAYDGPRRTAVLALTPLQIHRIALSALIEEAELAGAASLANAAARLGRLSLV
jgi:hypothetical protein